MMDWQPIETAPKDGTPIIGYDHGDVVRCWWQPEFDAFISSCREMIMAPGYTIDGQARKLHSPEIEHVSYWMPLDEPPTEI